MRDRVRVASSEKNYNNWVGAAKTMLAVEGSPDYCIFELGTNHRGEMRRLAAMVKPNMSLITNIAASHLEGLTDLEGVRLEKLELFEATSGGGAIFLNADDPSLAPYRRADCAAHTFGMRGRRALHAPRCVGRRPGRVRDRMRYERRKDQDEDAPPRSP